MVAAVKLSILEGSTKPKKNGGLEDDVPFQRGDFQVPCHF